jgi:hypothetical protein
MKRKEVNISNRKGHMKNNSDFMSSNIVKTEMDEWGEMGMERDSIKNIERRMEKLEAKIIKTEKGLFEWVMG